MTQAENGATALPRRRVSWTPAEAVKVLNLATAEQARNPNLSMTMAVNAVQGFLPIERRRQVTPTGVKFMMREYGSLIQQGVQGEGKVADIPNLPAVAVPIVAVDAVDLSQVGTQDLIRELRSRATRMMVLVDALNNTLDNIQELNIVDTGIAPEAYAPSIKTAAAAPVVDKKKVLVVGCNSAQYQAIQRMNPEVEVSYIDSEVRTSNGMKSLRTQADNNDLVICMTKFMSHPVFNQIRSKANVVSVSGASSDVVRTLRSRMGLPM